jgi:predicted molibdopterin-dependent oxidoreductase YjgC
VFVRLRADQPTMLSVTFEGQALQLREGLSVAAALLEADIGHFRDTPVSGSPRAPFCMMGICFDCLLIIDGIANQQACMTELREGMVIERQSGAADAMRYDSQDDPLISVTKP